MPVGATLSVSRHIKRKERINLAAFLVAGLCLVVTSIFAIVIGPFHIDIGSVLAILSGQSGTNPEMARDAMVISNIRLPRVCLALLVGGALAICGALMQGLFRNPLADPGLVGVSAGAALAAAATVVLGDRYLTPIFGTLPFVMVPVGAFFGGLITTFILYLISTRHGRTSVATMLLAGIALGALSAAVMGLMAYMSNDQQLRDITFWTLGSLGGASWTKVAIVAAIVLPLFIVSPFLARGLNALLLGEADAYYAGFSVQRLKIICVILVAAAVGVSVAAAGVIGFVGIVVPHVVRMMIGADHRVLLPLSCLLGGVVLAAADILARILVAPAELPIGILTALIGAPFFLWLLLGGRKGFAL